MPWTTTSQAGTAAPARARSRSIRGPATAAFVGVSVTCRPMIGARFESNAKTNVSTSRACRDDRLNTVVLKKRSIVSMLPSCRKPKPRT
jgi:hypothetical protein